MQKVSIFYCEEYIINQTVKIAFVTAQYDKVDSGPGTFAYYLRQATIQGKLDLIFFSQDIRTKQYEFEFLVKPKIYLPSLLGHILQQFAFHQAFTNIRTQKHIDILWYNSSYDSFVSSLYNSNVPLVIMINDYSKSSSRKFIDSCRIFGWKRTLKNRILYEFEKRSLKRADIVVVNSLFMKNEVETQYSVKQDRIRLLYKGVDLEMFESKNKISINVNNVNILFVKNDYKRGGLAELIQALARLEFNTNLTVVGPSAFEKDAIHSLIHSANYKGTVNFRGRVSRKQISNEFVNHDILCVPSRSEALGVVFMEALASGIPAIGTNVGGIPEVLDFGRAGWLVPPHDPESLARCIEEVVENVESRNRKVKYGLLHVTKFSSEKMIDRVKEIAQEIMTMD